METLEILPSWFVVFVFNWRSIPHNSVPLLLRGQSGQVHRCALKRQHPRCPQSALVGCITVGTRIRAVVLRLEQEIRHLPRSRIQEIGGYTSV